MIEAHGNMPAVWREADLEWSLATSRLFFRKKLEVAAIEPNKPIIRGGNQPTLRVKVCSVAHITIICVRCDQTPIACLVNAQATFFVQRCCQKTAISRKDETLSYVAQTSDTM